MYRHDCTTKKTIIKVKRQSSECKKIIITNEATRDREVAAGRRNGEPRLGAGDAELAPGNLGSALEFTAGLWFYISSGTTLITPVSSFLPIQVRGCFIFQAACGKT